MALYMADFETTVEENTDTQKESYVWAFGLAKLFDGTENVEIGNCIEDFLEALATGRKDVKKIVYFTNLKFDGAFILDYLIRELNFVSGYDEKEKKFVNAKKLKPNQMSYVITNLGIWYVININYKGYQLEFRDTLKLLPFSVEELGEAFETKHRKLKMKYKGNMRPRGVITPKQRAYITNDILVPKEALEAFLSEIKATRNPPLTISQYALSQFKQGFTKELWNKYFPNLADFWAGLDPDEFENLYGSKNTDAYIRKSYMGGWCYANERYTGIKNGFTKVFDVNSLYPSMMRDHQNLMPIGYPVFTKSQMELANVMKEKFFFIRFKCRFTLKNGYFPFLQLKHDFNYRQNENLKTSKRDLYGHDIEYYKPEITLAKPMFLLFAKCYHIEDFEFLDAAIFDQEEGLFDYHVDRFKKMKFDADKEKNVVKRNVAKLVMNATYGKFGKNPENIFKLLSMDGQEVIYEDTEGEEGKPVYIPIASAITAYARRFTVKAAILNAPYYRYSDTDSLHLCCDPEYTPKGMIIHDTDLSCWKEESTAKHSIFLRQKTYIEYTDNDYDVKACGLPDRSKKLFIESLRGTEIINGTVMHKYKKKGKEFEEVLELSENELNFMSIQRIPEDFKVGLSIPGKLLPKKVIGGVVLNEVDFTIK